MAEVKLWCAVYGEGTMFSVKVVRHSRVHVLQDAIADILSTKQPTIRQRPLTLYLARKNGEWLKDDANLRSLLHGEVDKQLKEMYSWWMLDDAEYLGKGFEPGDKEIHVLVELSADAVGVASETPRTAPTVKKMREQAAQTKRKRYVHSEMNSNIGNALLQKLRIRVKPVDTVPFAGEAPAPVQAFGWGTSCDGHEQNVAVTEEQQRERYRAYVEDNIGDVLKKERLCVLGVEEGNDILSVAVPGRNIELVGRTDILVLSDHVKQVPSDLMYLPDGRMLIKVKRVMEDSSDFQALSELIALDLLANHTVMALLTNLTDRWQFFWVSEKKNNHAIIQTTTTSEPGEAFEVIRTLLAQPPSADAEINIPFCEEPLMKRRKLSKVLPTVSGNGGGGSILESIQRYYDIASVLGPDIEMARAVADQIVRSIPAFSMHP